ncbi:hypothetical protein OC842_000382 [Tilletia horrida]|uniref:Cytochrome P450 n=1 Tax=Tilletia horrida TaxID=155126 RepID=A0AAN6GH26_9BASI|nr:hypothetical protein OC842_000382 [Tilletia horrida]
MSSILPASSTSLLLLGPLVGLVALALMAGTGYLLLFTPAGDGILLRRKPNPRERDFNPLGGDAMKTNKLLDAIPAWERAGLKTLNSEHPLTEHFALWKLHAELRSPIVRTGPNQVHVADVASHRVIFNHGQESYCKGKMYELFDDAGMSNVFSFRFKDEHAPRRKLLSHAFAPNSVRTMRPFISQKLDALLQLIHGATKEGTNKPIDMMTAYQCMSGDITIKFAFAHDAQMVESGKLDQLLLDIRKRTKAAAPSRRVHRAFELLPALSAALPYLPEHIKSDVTAMRRLDQSLKTIVGRFMANGGDEGEVFQKIVSAIDDTTGRALPAEVLMVESRGIVIAGVETTAAFLTFLTWELSRRPELYDTLLEELKTLMPHRATGADAMATFLPDPAEIAKLPFLSMLMMEVFRVYPAGARPFPRVVPKGGATFHGHFLPAGTEITCATWLQHRWDADLWGAEPLRFRPERWVEAQREADPTRFEGMKRALVPFSTGPRTCIGRHLAMEVLHLAIAAVFRNYRPSTSTDPDAPGMLSTEEDMTFIGYLVAFPKSHQLRMRWERVQE